MVEFIQQEWKKVVIHETIKFDFNALVGLHALGIPPGGIGRPLLWANGVIFEHNVMPPTRDVIRDQLSGTVHWSSLQFAFMREYKKSITVDNILIHIGNVNSNNLFYEMAEWLKKTFKEK
jgi:hypothetical protein